MKNRSIQVVFLVFLIIAPLLLSSFKQMESNTDSYELSESPSDEDQNEERESEESEDVGDYDLCSQHLTSYLKHNPKNFFSTEKPFLVVYSNITTPPPELG
jgi:hypothetical protein